MPTTMATATALPLLTMFVGRHVVPVSRGQDSREAADLRR
jgi:hypothetical protein